MKTLLFFLALTPTALSQNEMWTRPLAEQDTTITYTIGANRIDSLVYVAQSGRHITQGIFDAEHIAARLRLGPLSFNVSTAEIDREVQRMRDQLARELDALDAENLAAADYRTAARAIKAKARQYSRVSKKGASVTE